MALISLDEAKSYLRVDTEDEDAMIAILLSSAGRLCADVARLTDEQWAAVNDDNADAALAPVRETMRVAILYALGYLFEHREEADHHGLTLTCDVHHTTPSRRPNSKDRSVRVRP